jgi:hypothetical protein
MARAGDIRRLQTEGVCRCLDGGLLRRVEEDQRVVDAEEVTELVGKRRVVDVQVDVERAEDVQVTLCALALSFRHARHLAPPPIRLRYQLGGWTRWWWASGLVHG